MYLKELDEWQPVRLFSFPNTSARLPLKNVNKKVFCADQGSNSMKYYEKHRFIRDLKVVKDSNKDTNQSVFFADQFSNRIFAKSLSVQVTFI